MQNNLEKAKIIALVSGILYIVVSLGLLIYAIYFYITNKPPYYANSADMPGVVSIFLGTWGLITGSFSLTAGIIMKKNPKRATHLLLFTCIPPTVATVLEVVTKSSTHNMQPVPLIFIAVLPFLIAVWYASEGKADDRKQNTQES